MGSNYTGSLTVNGMNNFLALLKTAGYNGPAIVQNEAILYNISTTVPAYVHETDSNVNVPGTKQVETLTCAGTVTVAGNAKAVVTSATMTGSPLTIAVPVTVGMVAKDIRTAAINALSSNPITAAFFDFTHDFKTILVATVKTIAANDGTLDLTISDDTSTGVTTASSANTTAGALATTSGLPVVTDATLAPSNTFFFLKGTDLSSTWIDTASSIPLKVAVVN